MRRTFFSLLLCFFASLLLPDPVFPQEWKELKGDHFIIYHLSDDHFAEDVLRKAEEYYRDISSDLGYQRYSNFWQWENRVKIYIYATREDYQSATGEKGWSYGVANYTKKEIRSYRWSQGFVQALLPHEMTHLIFRDYVGFQGEVPLWLDEGVAQWEEPAKRKVVRQIMKSVLEKGQAFGLRQLTGMDVREVSDAKVARLFYIQAASIIEFLVKEHGTDNFTIFCRQLRDGKDLDGALKFSYPTSMRDLDEVEAQWRKYILG